MATVQFTYYLHDDYSSSERADYILQQLRPQGVEMDEDEFSELIGRPFYEIKLECELDLATGQVTILKTSK